ncbi:MAG TPA: hypothetical protein VFA09_26955 [Ktedonobacteraceae bacterium]|nr:hypothetical protein [Ktedonobacteraceae bacterium]
MGFWEGEGEALTTVHGGVALPGTQLCTRQGPGYGHAHIGMVIPPGGRSIGDARDKSGPTASRRGEAA